MDASMVTTEDSNITGPIDPQPVDIPTVMFTTPDASMTAAGASNTSSPITLQFIDIPSVMITTPDADNKSKSSIQPENISMHSTKSVGSHFDERPTRIRKVSPSGIHGFEWIHVPLNHSGWTPLVLAEIAERRNNPVFVKEFC